MAAYGKRAKRPNRTAFLWIGSAIVGLCCFGIVWAVQNVLIRMQFYPLLAVQGVVYDRGMSQHAHQMASNRKGAGPVVVVQIRTNTQEALQDVTLRPPGSTQPLTFRNHQRAFHARVVDTLRKLGARVIAIDMLFDQADPETDADFARAIREHGRVVLAALREESNLEEGGRAESDQIYYPEATLRGSASMGIVNIPMDPDKTVRRFSWWLPGIDEDTGEDALLPTLGVAAAALYGGVNPRKALETEFRPRGTFLGGRVQWLPDAENHSRTSYIRFTGPRGFPSGPDSIVAYEDVFRAGEDPNLFASLQRQCRDKIVLIGNSATIAHDYHRVPVLSYSIRNGRSATQEMPGVEIQAHVIQTALGGRYVHQATDLTQVLLLLATCLLIALMGRLLNPAPLVALTAVLFAVLWGGSIALLAESRIWLEPVTASVGALLTAVGETGFMYFAERGYRLQVRRQLSRHVGPGVADKLAEDEWPELSGESREITMLFSDLQGFTSLSETMSSAEICALLNRYFGVIFPILDRYSGTVDKLMGDGMMAYFGWPIREPNHAWCAVRCAIEIEEELEAWLALPENAGLPRLRTRIGIHTGVATIGEIGTGTRTEFTVIGDIVNVASRLEGMNKDYGTSILISDATYQPIQGKVLGTFRGNATVRGRKEPMPVYSIEPKFVPTTAITAGTTASRGA